MKSNKKVLIVSCVIIFLMALVLSCVCFMLSSDDVSYEMRNILETEISSLENTLKKSGIINKKVAYDSNSKNGEYWTDDDVRDYNNSMYVFMGFTYEQLHCEAYLIYQDDAYTVELSFGNADLSSLTEENKAGVEKMLNVFDTFCNTNSFTPSFIEKNYSSDYFTAYYESEKYEALNKDKQYGISEMCSYEVFNEKGSYTYFCSENSDKELVLCKISIAYNRTADEKLILEKGGESND